MKGELIENKNLAGIQKEGFNELEETILKPEEVFEKYKNNASIDLFEAEGQQLKHGSTPEFSQPMLENEQRTILPNKERKHIIPDNKKKSPLKLDFPYLSSGKKDKKIDENGGLEDDPDLSYEDKDEGIPDFSNFPCNVEGTLKNYKKKSFPLSVRRKKGSNLNRPGSDQILVDPKEIYVDARKQTPLVFVCTKTMPTRRGEEPRAFHNLTNNCYRYVRRKVKPNGRAYFGCSVKGCRAMVKADYRSKEVSNEEEPKVYLPSLPTNSCHMMEDGTVHPVQAGLRLVEEARRRMKDRVAQNPISPESGRQASVQEIYREVYEEIIAGCEGRDSEEFEALCPKATSMEKSFFRWRKDAKREQGLIEGCINEEAEVGLNDLNDIDMDNDVAPVVERDQLEMKFISTTSGNGKIYHHFSNNLYKFDRVKVSLKGRGYFTCSVQRCKAYLKADYTSKEAVDQEEPLIDQSTVPPFSSHILENGRVHPVQAGLRLVEEARRRMRSKVVENVARPVPEIYKEVHQEILAVCEEEDREELAALFPSLKSMESRLYRWMKDWGSVPHPDNKITVG